MNIFVGIYEYIARRTRRKGFGVHSPFAYTMTKDLFSNKYKYYDQHLIDDLNLNRIRRKQAKILFRLSARLGAEGFISLSPEVDKLAKVVKIASPRISVYTSTDIKGIAAEKCIIFAEGTKAMESITDEMLISSLAIFAETGKDLSLAERISSRPHGILFIAPGRLIYFPYPATRFIAYDIEI